MDGEQMEILEAACQQLGRNPARLWSGAGHDAAILARHVPTAMLFVPSKAGLSHNPKEWTEPAQLLAGAAALTDAVAALDKAL